MTSRIELEASAVESLPDDAVPGRKLTVELERDAELLNAVDPPSGRVEGEVEHAALGPVEEDGLVEGSGGLEDSDDRTGRRVHDEPRDDPCLFVVEIETEKELALPGGASNGEKRLLTERRTGQRERPEGGHRSVRGSARRGGSRACRQNHERAKHRTETVRPKRRRLHPFVLHHQPEQELLSRAPSREVVSGFAGANLPGILVDFRALARR